MTPAVRLDDELAAVEGRFRAADFNLCPVAREHDAPRRDRAQIDDHFALRDFDVLALDGALPCSIFSAQPSSSISAPAKGRTGQ